METRIDYFVATSNFKQIFKCSFQTLESAKRHAENWVRQMETNGKYEKAVVYKRATTTNRDWHGNWHRTTEEHPEWEFYWSHGDGSFELEQNRAQKG